MDPTEQEAPPPPRSPVSAFLWAGLTCVVVGALIGVRSILIASQIKSDAPLGGLFYALWALGCSVPLFYAQARYLFWRRASGIVEHHPLTPDALKVKTRMPRAEKQEWALILIVLLVLAIVPRWLRLPHPLAASEMDMARAVQRGMMPTNPAAQTYAYLVRELLGFRLSLLGTATANNFPPSEWLRFPAWLCGVASVPALYLTLRFLFGRPAALASALLLTFSPQAVVLSTTASSASAVLFFGIAQGFFFAQTLKECNAGAWVGWLACCIAGTVFDPFFAVIPLITAVFLLGRAAWIGSTLRLPARSSALVEQSVVMTTAYAAFAFFLAGSLGWSVGNRRSIFALNVSPLMPSTLVLSVVGIVALIGLLSLWWRPSGLAPYALLVGVTAFTASAAFYFAGEPTLLLCLPLFLTLIVFGIKQIIQWFAGATAEKSLIKEGSLYAVILLSMVLQFPTLRAVMSIADNAKTRTTVNRPKPRVLR
jgi:hypothetical protein